MPEKPEFLDNFSKRTNAEGRSALAAKILEARAEQRAASPELSESAEAAVGGYRELGAKIGALTNNGVSRVNELLSWAGVKRRLAASATSENVAQAVEVPAQFAEPKKLLEDFRDEERKRWATSEGSPEEMRELFSEKHLASLSMDDYALLLKRFPSAMVTHVTRQGIRDHTRMHEHTKGRGEYADGFMKMLQDGELKSPLAVSAMERGKEDAIAKAIKLDHADSREDAQARLKDSLSSAFDGYADVAAVHVATEEVADRFYGSEKGNEVFIAYPSAHIAAEHQFVGRLATAGGDEHNDTWILTDGNLDKGMDLDAGIVFIPAEAKVDSVTGSRYALDESKQPIEDAESKSVVGELVSSNDFQHWLSERIHENKKAYEIADMIEERFGIADSSLRISLASYGKAPLSNDPFDAERRKNDQINKILERSGLQYKKAENTVTSQEYWENYFAQHPEQRPSKIEYYKGTDPTNALLKWKQKHGLDNAGTESSYDVGGRIGYVGDHESEDKERFRSIAEKLISERFPEKSEIAGNEEAFLTEREAEEQLGNAEVSLRMANAELEQLRNSGASEGNINELVEIIQMHEARRARILSSRRVQE